MQTYSYTGDDFRVLLESGDWKIGLLRYADRFARPDRFERHLQTDEAFALLRGSATLYVRRDEKIESAPLLAGQVILVPAGEWHQIVVSRDADVLVVENRDTSAANTEKDPPLFAGQTPSTGRKTVCP